MGHKKGQKTQNDRGEHKNLAQGRPAFCATQHLEGWLSTKA